MQSGKFGPGQGNLGQVVLPGLLVRLHNFGLMSVIMGQAKTTGCLGAVSAPLTPRSLYNGI